MYVLHQDCTDSRLICIDIYTAAIVLLASRLRPSLETHEPKYSLVQSWSHAIEMLNWITPLSKSAQRSVVALEILAATISVTADGDLQHSMNNMNQLGSTQNVAAFQNLNGTFNEFYDMTSLNGIILDPNDISWLNSIPV